MNQNETVRSYCWKMAATTAALSILMLISANDPSTDDAVRGGIGGVIGWIFANLIGRRS